MRPFRLFGALLALSAACALAAPAAAKPRANAPASAAAEKDPVLLSRELAGLLLDLGYSSASINALFNTKALGEMPAEWLPIFTDATMAEAAARREQLIGMLAPILQSKFTLPELRAGVGYLRTPTGRRTLQAAIRAGAEDRDMTESEVDSGLVELVKKPAGRAFFEKFGELEHELGGFDGEVQSLMAPGILRRASDGIEATTKPLAPLTAAERDALEVLRAILPEQMMMQGVRAGAEAKAKDKAAMAQLPAGWGGWLVEALVAEMNVNPGLLHEILARAWAAKAKPEDLRAMVVFLKTSAGRSFKASIGASGPTPVSIADQKAYDRFIATDAGKAMTGFYTTVSMRAAGLEYGFRLAPALYRRLADRIEAAAKGARMP